MRALFLKSESKGVLSEADRDYLEDIHVELSDSSRRKAFIQKNFICILCLQSHRIKSILHFLIKRDRRKRALPSYLLQKYSTQMFPDIPIDTSKELNSQFKYIKNTKSDLVL